MESVGPGNYLRFMEYMRNGHAGKGSKSMIADWCIFLRGMTCSVCDVEVMSSNLGLIELRSKSDFSQSY